MSELLEVRVGPPAHGGHCVARADGRVIFVRHALPGELVRVSLTDGGDKRRFWRGDAVEILEPSADRVPSVWPEAGPGGVGGGELAHVALGAQRAWKTTVLHDTMRRIGHVDLPEAGLAHVAVEALPGDDERNGLGTRTRIDLVVGADGRAGMFGHRSHDVVAITSMPLAVPAIEDLGLFAEPWGGLAPGARLDVVAPSQGSPVVLVDGVPVGDGADLRGAPRAAAPSDAVDLSGAGTGRGGVRQTHANRGEGSRGVAGGAGRGGSGRGHGPGDVRGRGAAGRGGGAADGRGRDGRQAGRPAGSAHAGDAGRGDAGRGPHGAGALALPGAGAAPARTSIREVVATPFGEITYRVSAGGFWQVHREAPAVLTAAVLDAADPQTGERVLDLYSGSGLFTVPLAHAVGEAGRVDAVEGDERAVKDARRNLHAHPNAVLHAERVDEASLGAIAGDGAGVDVVVLDPPRSGAGGAVMGALAALGPRRIVYVACDPAALARDVAAVAAHGYRLRGLRAFDLFPHTHHFESVAVLEHD
ncbi:TRAM domain-containing protein [Georgenia sp. MJ206]|uniref:class I SAM-dependent RNA methyltransferase n=1 Tax=Georgenia wangjunii TaxID=3117730 RepID=UPI002F2669AC